jgi:DNA-binding transcriptional LysR family regulator
MDRLEAMAIFVAAMEHGSLSAASRKLRIPLTTVSRRVSELEDHIGVQLILRGTRKLTLTEAGAEFIVACKRIIDDVSVAERVAAGEYHSPRGELILSAPQAMGRAHAIPIVAEFLRACPDVRMRVQLDDRRVNLLDDHVDVALRIGALADSSMVALRVGGIRQVVCASPGYLEKREAPVKPADLAGHDCVGYESLVTGSKWTFLSNGVPESITIESRLIVNSLEAAAIAAISGAGIALLLSYQIEEPTRSGQLVRLLTGYEPESIPVSLLYSGQLHVPLKLRAFLDFTAPRLRQRLAY